MSAISTIVGAAKTVTLSLAAGVTMGHLSAQTHTSTQPPPGAGEIPDTELVLVVGGVGRIPSRDQCDHTPDDCDGPSHVMCRYYR